MKENRLITNPDDDNSLLYVEQKEEMLNDEIIKRLYNEMEFNFFKSNQFFNDKDSDKSFYGLFANHKLITYKFCKPIFEPKKSSNIVFCFEKTCLVIDSIDQTLIREKIEKSQDIIFLNSDNFKDKLKKCKEHIYKSLTKKMKNNNLLFNITIDPVLVYLIQRFYYPTHFFNDKKIFQIDRNKIQFRKDDLIELLQIKTDKPIIFLVFHIKTLQLFAMKLIDDETHAQNELYFYNHIQHDCLTPYYGTVKDGRKTIGIIYKYMSNGSLENYRNKKNVNSMFSIITMNRISQGIKHLHDNSFIHRDISPSNILIDNDENAYISDFEDVICIKNEEEIFINNDIGKQSYISPEQKKGKITFQSDIYSFGLLIYFLFEGKHLNTNDYELNSEKIHQMKNACKEVKNIILDCIKEPKERPSINDIMKTISNVTNNFSTFQYYLIPNITIDSMIKLFKETEKLSHHTNIHFKMKYFWIFSLFYLLYQINQSCCFYALGLFYYYGNHFMKDKNVLDKPNIPKAIENLKKAVSNSDALLLLGKIYYKDAHVPRDTYLAKQYFQASADLGNAEAYYYLGELKYQKDILKSIKFYELAGKMNYSQAYATIGDIYFKSEKNFQKAKDYYEKAAYMKNSDALFQLGKMYYIGKGVEKNYIRAREYFILAIKENNFTAALFLGNMYWDGKGVDINIKKALDYYFLSIRYSGEINYNLGRGHKMIYSDTIAYNNIGLIYLLYNKYNDPVMFEKAKYYIQKSNDSDFQFGINNLGLIYELYLKSKNEQEALQFKKRALELYQKASKKKFSLAEFNLGRLYEKNGDLEKAIECFICASKHEDNPVRFIDEDVYDDKLESSIHFVVRLANLKLCKYYLSKNDLQSFQFYLAKLIGRDNFSFGFQTQNVYSIFQKFILEHSFYHQSDFISKEKVQKTNFIYKRKNDDMKKKELEEKIQINFIQQIENLDDFFASLNRDLFIQTISDIIDKMSNMLLFYPCILFGRFDKIKKSPSSKNINQLFFDGFWTTISNNHQILNDI